MHNLVVRGFRSDLNFGLSSLIYRGEEHFKGEDAISISVTDPDGATTSISIPVRVISQNDYPSVVLTNKTFGHTILSHFLVKRTVMLRFVALLLTITKCGLHHLTVW